MAVKDSTVVVYKHLLRELKRIYPKSSTEWPAVSFVRDQFRRYQVTSEKTCKARNEVEHVAQTYVSLLANTRKFEDLNMQYKGRGERTVEESANLVGLQLPAISPELEK